MQYRSSGVRFWRSPYVQIRGEATEVHFLPSKEIRTAPTSSQHVGGSAVAFIDSRVERSGILVAEIREGVGTVLLDASRSNPDRLDKVLMQRSGVREVHIVSREERSPWVLSSPATTSAATKL